MESFKTARKRAQENEQVKKLQLYSAVRAVVDRHINEGRYLRTSAQELNDAGIHTLRGGSWNPKNLWSFLSLNADLANDQNPASTLARPETSVALVCVSTPLKESPVGDLLDWAMRFQTLGILPVHVSDQELLRRVMIRLEEKGETLSGLVEDLLRDWDRQEAKLPALPEADNREEEMALNAKKTKKRKNKSSKALG